MMKTGKSGKRIKVMTSIGVEEDTKKRISKIKGNLSYDKFFIKLCTYLEERKKIQLILKGIELVKGKQKTDSRLAYLRGKTRKILDGLVKGSFEDIEFK